MSRPTYDSSRLRRVAALASASLMLCACADKSSFEGAHSAPKKEILARVSFETATHDITQGYEKVRKLVKTQYPELVPNPTDPDDDVACGAEAGAVKYPTKMRYSSIAYKGKLSAQRDKVFDEQVIAIFRTYGYVALAPDKKSITMMNKKAGQVTLLEGDNGHGYGVQVGVITECLMTQSDWNKAHPDSAK